jgi:hypothetical protein
MHAGCEDKTPPRQSKALIIPHELYFGNASGSWDGKGVAFLDASQPGDTLGRMYLITEAQFSQIHKQEGPGTNWYNHIVTLGEEDGIAIRTFTNSGRRPANPPSAAYLDVILSGMQELMQSEEPHKDGKSSIDIQSYYNRFRQMRESL